MSDEEAQGGSDAGARGGSARTGIVTSADASPSYLTVSEIFPVETRALVIAFFYAIGTAAGGIAGPLTTTGPGPARGQRTQPATDRLPRGASRRGERRDGSATGRSGRRG